MSEYEVPSMWEKFLSWFQQKAPTPVPDTIAEPKALYTEDLVEFVKSWEGLKLVPSGDPLVPGVADVGYGHVLGKSDPKTRITREQADAMLREDLDAVAAGVKESVHVKLEQHQFDALCTFAYNLGNHALATSTLMQYVNARMFDLAAGEFERWCNAGGRPVEGLRKRRRAERAIFADANYSGRP